MKRRRAAGDAMNFVDALRVSVMARRGEHAELMAEAGRLGFTSIEALQGRAEALRAEAVRERGDQPQGPTLVSANRSRG